MSIKKLVTYTFIIFISAGIGYVGNYYYYQFIGPEQLTHLSSHQKPFLQGKNQDAVLVKIESPILPKSDQELVEIVGYIKGNFENLDSVKYQWLLPNDVQVVEGNIVGEISGEEAGQVQTLKLKISGFSLEQRKVISLQVDTSVGNQAVGNSYSVSSQPKETWEYYAKEMKKNKDEFVAASQNDDSTSKEVKIIK